MASGLRSRLVAVAVAPAAEKVNSASPGGELLATGTVGAATASAEPRVTKEQMVIQALCRPEGATVTELMELTGWQAHSVRGFLSGMAKKKLGLTVERITGDGRTVYRVPSVPV